MTVYSPARHFALGDPIDAPTLARLEDYAFRYGRSYDSYLATEDGEYFWCSDQRGVIRFARRRRYVVVVGGLLAPEEAWDLLLVEFLEFTARHGYHVTFFNLDERFLPVFRRHDFQITKIGQDAIINAGRCTWKGKA